MKKSLLIILFSVSLLSKICSQRETALIDSANIPIPYFHAQTEYNFDVPANPSAWEHVKPGLHVAFGSTNQAYFRREVPMIKNASEIIETTAWKGERVNGIIVAWSPDTVSQVRFVLHDLKNEKGDILAKSHIKLNLVRYVISNYPYDARDVSCGEGPVDKAYLMPDRFESFDRFDLPGRSVRPVWLSLDVPGNIPPGIYKGDMELRSDKGNYTLHIAIKVQNQTLPKPRDWSFSLDLWQNPWVIAEYYHVKPWSEAHKILLRQHLKLYADAGGKFITTYAVNSPWADNSYRNEQGMIEWIKQKNGKWRFDYQVFDQYVQLAMETGIDKAITVYTPIPWGERFRYLDESTGGYVFERWPPASDTFKINWDAFLTDLRTHLEKKGWLSRTYLGVNENEMGETLAAIKVIKEHSRNWKIAYAGDWHPELDSLLDDYSCVYGKEPGVSDVRKREVHKKISTYYICCTPPKPNTFVFSPPVEARWLGWYAFAHGYDGLLRWAYDAWPADPERDPRHVLWPAGDCFMVYPGGNSSIRFEKMREGITDFEKLRILNEKAKRSTSPGVKDSMRQLKEILQRINDEKTFKEEKLQNDLQEANELVNKLSDQLKG